MGDVPLGCGVVGKFQAGQAAGRLAGAVASLKAGLSGRAGWQRDGMWSLAGGLVERRGAVAGDGGPRISGSVLTLPILGHTFLGSWVSPDLARWLI